MEFAYLNTPIGNLKVGGDSKGLSEISFTDEKDYPTTIPPSLESAIKQLKEYFDGRRTHFDLVLNPKGTDFQKSVWNVLSEIPYGKTKSYQEIANRLGDRKVIRAAARANGKNPIAVIIPCHRVIGSDGSLTGYAGGLHRKKWLLAHESPTIQGELF